MARAGKFQNQKKNIMELSGGDHITIDIPNHADKLLEENMKKSYNPFKSPRRCIFKIPKIIHRHNTEAYVPNAFSIGPLHHGRPHLKDSEQIKSQYLDDLISRAPTGKTSLENLTEAIKKLEGEARECYAVPIELTSDKFVNLLVVDGCFIIELLRRMANEVDRKIADPVLDTSYMLQFLQLDLLLLENQIPWLVLDRLFIMTTLPNSRPLHELASFFLDFSLNMNTRRMIASNHGSKHMLDLLRNMLVSSFGVEEGAWFERFQLIPNATSLMEAGIKFKASTSPSILDIKFNNGVLEIPPLMIQETTGGVFRNLISFEQCYHECTPMITSYAILLGNLITTTKDMNILRKHGIIDNWLIPEEAIKFFNEFYRDTFAKEFYYIDLCNKVNGYCECSWPRFRATYAQYFTSPYAIISQVVGGSALLLTFIQTIHSFIMK